MKITLDIGNVAFPVPATLSVRLPSGEPGNPPAPRLPDYNLPLSAFDNLTLDRLCREFRGEVFREAGKEPPPKQAISREEAFSALEVLKAVLQGGGENPAIICALRDLDTFLGSL